MGFWKDMSRRRIGLLLIVGGVAWIFALLKTEIWGLGFLFIFAGVVVWMAAVVMRRPW